MAEDFRTHPKYAATAVFQLEAVQRYHMAAFFKLFQDVSLPCSLQEMPCSEHGVLMLTAWSYEVGRDLSSVNLKKKIENYRLTPNISHYFLSLESESTVRIFDLTGSLG